MAFGRLPDDLILRIKRNLTLASAPDDPELWTLAHGSKGHISIEQSLMNTTGWF
jgi:hypothetical protein